MNREIATPLTIGIFLIMSVTGILMFFHWDTGFNKLAHEWLGWLMVVAVVLHILANMTAFKRHFSQGKGKWIVLALVGLLALSFLPQSLLGNGGNTKRPPMQQAMQVLGTADISTLAQLTHTTPEALMQKLTQQGYPVTSSIQTPSQIAGNDRDKQGQILSIVLNNNQNK